MSHRAPYHQKYNVKRQKKAVESTNEGSNEEILLFDVNSLLKDLSINSSTRGALDVVEDPPEPVDQPLPERFSQLDVNITHLSSTGDGLGTAVSGTHKHIYVVPFTLPGDLAQVKAVKHFTDAHYSLTDLVEIVKPGPDRHDSLVRCRYFAKCGGCQLQMLPYDAQLRHKRTIIEKAYRNFSSLAPEVVPAVGETIGSPRQYGYRTKLTPHFDGPPGSMNRRNRHERKGFERVPPIGFMMKGQRKTIDIEECPLGTDAVARGLKQERERTIKDIASYKKGATLLCRETTSRVPKMQDVSSLLEDTSAQTHSPVPVPNGVVSPKLTEDNIDERDVGHGVSSSNDFVEVKSCITDQKGTSTEYVDDFIFKNTAGSFFQNNNSILSPFTAYIRDHIMPPNNSLDTKPLNYLIDAYCGSGLFTVTLSSLFQVSIGIDVSDASIVSAKINATENHIKNSSFINADAARLFEQITFPADKTAVVIDPSKKGCDDNFLGQLLHFGPQRIVYVSCNVHTQARDVGVLVEGKGGARYAIESLRGFDFFPQTGQVESVAILSRFAS